jgi:hypothetical protein
MFGWRLRIKIERRPDAPPLWSWERLGGGIGSGIVGGDGGREGVQVYSGHGSRPSMFVERLGP